jgi:hypothetical protein
MYIGAKIILLTWLVYQSKRTLAKFIEANLKCSWITRFSHTLSYNAYHILCYILIRKIILLILIMSDTFTTWTRKKKGWPSNRLARLHKCNPLLLLRKNHIEPWGTFLSYLDLVFKFLILKIWFLGFVQI